MTARAAEAPERSTRRVLAAGGSLLVLGLAIVGVGGAADGGPIALAGLLATIYGIHRFGRLGPDDDASHETAAARLRTDAVWFGVLTLIAAVSFLAGAGSGQRGGAYLTLTAGALALAWGARRGPTAKKIANKDAEDKAPAPEAPAGDAPAPRRRRRKPRAS